MYRYTPKMVYTLRGTKLSFLFTDLTFEKADADKDTNKTRKRPIVACRRSYCSAPNLSFSSEKVKKLCDDLENLGQGNFMASLIKGNYFMRCDFFITSLTENKNSLI